MIGLILGTAEGKKILSLLNEFTEDIFVSTATSYGGELLQNYKYKVLNTKALNKEELEETLIKNKVTILIDGSHPYAQEITKNAIKVCSELNIVYVRYERPSVVQKFKENKNVILLDCYETLAENLEGIAGVILNTTGSRNIEKLMELNLRNRIVHRVLPSIEVMNQCFNLGVKVEDIVAIKGPISYDLNCSFIKEYKADAILLKDSGKQGGTEEKIRAAMDLGIYAFVIKRSSIAYDKIFYNEEELVQFVKVSSKK